MILVRGRAVTRSTQSHLAPNNNRIPIRKHTQHTHAAQHMTEEGKSGVYHNDTSQGSQCTTRTVQEGNQATDRPRWSIIVRTGYHVSNKTSGRRLRATTESKLGLDVWQRRTLKLQLRWAFAFPFLFHFKVVIQEQMG